MDGRELREKLHYTGMERDIRKLALEQGLATPEALAVMSIVEICNLVVEKYEVVYSESEELGLVKKCDMPLYNSIVRIIER